MQLEQSWKPLEHLLAGKLKWANILAEKKHLNLTITDTTKASVAFDESTNGGFFLTISISKIFSVLCVADITALGVSTSGNHMNPSLFLDMFRIDQVIRNLITNAVTLSTPIQYGIVRVVFR